MNKMTPSVWISFSDQRPPDDFRGYLLVTNALDAQNAFGCMSHVWLVSMVHYHDEGPNEFRGKVFAAQGEITAFSYPGNMPLRGLSHWRPAIAEDWAEYLTTRRES